MSLGAAIRHATRQLRGIGLMLVVAGLAGCQITDDMNFSKSGIGADLYSGDIAQATENLETYLGFICQQGSVPTVAGANGYPQCAYSTFRPLDWTIVVQTGFNDIDRRCDAYLQWLEEVRLRGSAINAELNDTQRLSNVFLTSLNATGVTIGLVGEAFGFARASFNNYQNKILLGFEGSTIKTIVSDRRLRFRNEFADVVFRLKPDAVNVLRSYLRICMPYTITMDANTYARALTIGIPQYLDPKVEKEAIVSEALGAKTAQGVATGNPSGTVLTGEHTGENDKNVLLLFGAGSKRGPASVKDVQAKLCIDPDGNVGDITRTGVAVWRRTVSGNIAPGDTELPLRVARDRDEARDILGAVACDAPFLAHYVERKLHTNYYEASELKTQGQIKDFVDTLNEAVTKAKYSIGPVLLPQQYSYADDILGFRDTVAKVRAALAADGKLKEPLPDGNDRQVTVNLRTALDFILASP